MASQYDNITLNNGEYIPQYAGLPLDVIKDTGDVLANRHYQNLAQLNQLQLMGEQMKSKALPGAKGYYDQHINQVSEALQDLAKNGGENSTARVQAMATAFLGDQGILNSQARSQEYLEKKKLIEQYKLKGDTPIYRGQGTDTDPFKLLENASPTDAVYNSPFTPGIEAYQDPNKDMEAIWSPINPDSYESPLRAAMNTTADKLGLGQAIASGNLPLFFETITKSGIGTEKIKNLLDAGWSNYKNTASYKQQTSDIVGKTDEQVKKEFYNKGLMRVFQNLSRDYRPTPAAALNADGSGQNPSVPQTTTAPAQTVETVFNYGADGHSLNSGKLAYPAPGDKRYPDPANFPGSIPYVMPTEVEYNKQYIGDYTTMAQIQGKTPPKPDSSEARKFAADYKSVVESRLSNSYVEVPSADQLADINKEIQSRYALHRFMDPITGRTFNAFDNNGQPTEEFLKLGDVSSFKVESVYSPKNHYSITGGKDFSKPIAITTTDKDGKPRRVLMSQLPTQTSPADININKIYTGVQTRPGQEIELNPRVKAQELYGAQIDDAITAGDLPPEAKQFTPIKAVIDGSIQYFRSADEMGRVLANPAQYGLSTQPIFLN